MPDPLNLYYQICMFCRKIILFLLAAKICTGYYPILQSKPIYTMRKLLTLIIAFLFTHLCSPAQLLQKILPNNGFSTSLAKVVENYETNYLYIQGGALPSDDVRDIFLSSLSIPGASRCVIYRFHSTEDTTASWQALLYTGEDFKQASKVYTNTFKQMKQIKFSAGGISNGLDGEMIAPTDAIRFTSSLLRPVVPCALYKNFIAEIEMINTIEGWTVQLNLHSRKDDDERYQK